MEEVFFSLSPEENAPFPHPLNTTLRGKSRMSAALHLALVSVALLTPPAPCRLTRLPELARCTGVRCSLDRLDTVEATDSTAAATVAVRGKEAAEAVVRTVEAAADEYRRGVLTVCFITLLFASNSPALHAALTSMEHAPPPLLLNALCGTAALVGLLWGGPLLRQNTALPSSLEPGATDAIDAVSVRAGGELGLLKFLGTTANLCGSSYSEPWPWPWPQPQPRPWPQPQPWP